MFEAHRLLGHINYAAVKHSISTGKVRGIELDSTSDAVFCEACAQAKPHRLPFPEKATNRAKAYGERIHANVWGPASLASLGGSRYTINFVDDATRWTEISLLHKKSDAFSAYKKLEAQINTHDKVMIKFLWTDRGGEFVSDAFSDHLAERGTKRELTTHDTHEQVGVVERWNRTKAELARAMLIDSKLPRFLWGEAMNHAAWIKNRSPTHALEGETPFHARYTKHPDLSKLVPFGTQAWIKIADAGKLERRAQMGHFVGLDWTSTGYRIYVPETKQIRIEREVVFNRDETTEPPTWTGEMPSEGEKTRTIRHSTIESDLLDSPETLDAQPLVDPLHENHEEDHRSEETEAPAPIDEPLRARARPEPGFYKTLAGYPPRGTAANVTLHEYDDHSPLFALHVGSIGIEPRTIAQALAGPDAVKWKKAYQIELDQLKRVHTWDIVPRPADKPVIPCGYVFKVKLGPKGEIVKYKARIVAGGHRQTKGTNYNETFAAAAKIASIRVLLALAAQRDWEIDQIDVVGAYLNAKLEDEVYMEPPHGVLNDEERGRVCRLRKGLYGLKQAGRMWYRMMAATFTSLGFKVSKLDQSAFICMEADQNVHVTVSTDDMVVMGNTCQAVDHVKSELRKCFETTDQGELSWLLGFEVKRNRGARTIALNQRAYLEVLTKRFGLEDARPVHIPMDPGVVLSKDQCPVQPIDAPYQEACGGVLWPAVITRPDVQLAIGILSQFTMNLAPVHWEAMKQLITYLKTSGSC